MAQIDFRMLNTSAPYEVGTSFQRGMDEAMLRKQAQEKFEADKQQRAVTNQYNTQQQDLLRMNYENDAEKIRVMKADKDAKRKASQQESEVGRLMANSLLGAPAFKVVDTGEGYDLDIDEQLYQQAMQNMQPTSADQPNPMIERAQKMGISPEMLQTIAVIAEQNPKEAAKLMGRATMERMKAQLKGEFGKPAKEDEFTRWINMSPDQKQAFETFKGIGKRPLIEKGAFNITNEMGGEAAKMAAKKEGMEIGEQAAMIENKYSALDSVREAKDILRKGIYAGTYGDFKKMLAKGSFGAIGDRQKAINTEEFISYIGNTVVPRLKEFGGNDSNEEMRYLKSIMGGDTSMEPEAIARIIESAERKILRGIERLQRQRGAIEQGSMPDLGPGPARGQSAPTKTKPLTTGVRKYNPVTGRIE